MPVVNELSIARYKTFIDFSLDFSSGVTVISGANGTGKSSLLHLISNSFQKPGNKHRLSKSGLSALSTMPGILNLKIDRLSRGDKIKNDPAGGVRGEIYAIAGDSFERLTFRRHRSPSSAIPRFYLKPYYAANGVSSMPVAAVAYLGIGRLLAHGEFDDSRTLTKRAAFDSDVRQEIIKNYRSLTLLDIDMQAIEDLGGIKRRIEFSTNKEGVDSNTISAGQDNVLIILSAMENLAALARSDTSIPRIMLVDEFDATLHPDLQIRLLSLMVEYSEKYQIQFILTTQSMDLLDYALSVSKVGVVYLMRTGASVGKLQDLSPSVIRLHLRNATTSQLGRYKSPAVAVFTEDDEARSITQNLLRVCCQMVPDLGAILSALRFVEVRLGSTQLRGLFQGEDTRDILGSSICVLDGDSGSPSSPEWRYLITYLPGGSSPEAWLIDWATHIVTSSSSLLIDPEWVRKNYSFDWISRFISDVNNRLEEANSNDSRLRPRDVYKSVFKENYDFFEYLLASWVRDPENVDYVAAFIRDFGRVYSRASAIADAPDVDWSSVASRFAEAISST